MLIQYINGKYAVAHVLSNGEVARTGPWENKEFALLEKHSLYPFDSLEKMKSEGWSIVQPTLETLTGGELVKDEDDNYSRILTRIGGIGELSVYLLSDISSEKDGNNLKKVGCTYTAYELKELGYTIVDESDDKRTLGQVLADLPESDAEIIKDALK